MINLVEEYKFKLFVCPEAKACDYNYETNAAVIWMDDKDYDLVDNIHPGEKFGYFDFGKGYRKYSIYLLEKKGQGYFVDLPEHFDTLDKYYMWLLDNQIKPNHKPIEINSQIQKYRIVRSWDRFASFAGHYSLVSIQKWPRYKKESVYSACYQNQRHFVSTEYYDFDMLDSLNLIYENASTFLDLSNKELLELGFTEFYKFVAKNEQKS